MTSVSASHAPAAASREALADLVYREAHLLDEQRYDEWLALYATECCYWMPLDRAQTDWKRNQSIVAEDRLLLSVRVERLKARQAPSLSPMPRSQHVLQAPQAEGLVTRTPFLYVEARDEEQIMLVGTLTHSFKIENGALRITEKRIDLVNAGAGLPSIFLIP